MLLFLDQNPPTYFFCSLSCIDMWMMVMPRVPHHAIPEYCSGCGGHHKHNENCPAVTNNWPLSGRLR